MIGMPFHEAYRWLKQGYKIKRNHWDGYWYKKDDTIFIHEKDGNEFDIRVTIDVFFTFDNIASCDWVVIDKENI